MTAKNQTADDLKLRVLQAKAKLPKGGIQAMMCHAYPEYCKDQGKSLLNDVLLCRRTDKKVTERLEKMAENITY